VGIETLQVIIIIDFELVQGSGGAPENIAPPGGNTTGNAQIGGYGQAAPPAKYQRTAGGAVARDANAPRPIPISRLNPYQNRWSIKARVTSKGPVRTFNGKNGEGKVMSFDLVDESQGEIRVTAWHEVAQRMDTEIQVGKVYTISKASLKPARKQYNHLNNDYEITLEAQSEVEECTDAEAVAAIPTVAFNFKPIADIAELPASTVVDVVGVVEAVNPANDFVRKDGQTSRRRSVTLRDASNGQIELTLWGQAADDEGARLEADTQNGQKPILAIKGARVGDWNGKTLSSLNSSVLLINAVEMDEAVALRTWYDNQGCQQAATNLSAGQGMERGGRSPGSGKGQATVAMVKEEHYGMVDYLGGVQWVNVTATVTYVRSDNMYYPSCPNVVSRSSGKEGPCMKRVTQEEQGGHWYCEKCMRSTPTPDYRYVLSVAVNDLSGSLYVNAFQEMGKELLGMDANDLKGIEGSKEYDRVLKGATFRRLKLRLKCAKSEYQGEMRQKVEIQRVDKINWAEECQELIGLIKRHQAGEPKLFLGPTVPKGAAAAAAAGGGGGGMMSSSPGAGYQHHNHNNPYGSFTGAYTPPKQHGGDGMGGGGYNGGGGYSSAYGGGYGGGGMGQPFL